jgi:TPR repeat protein
MNHLVRPWRSAILLAFLLLLPSSSFAGMSPEEVKAFESYRAKAMKGDPGAQHTLGFFYYSGEGVLKDYGQAVLWLRKAAEQGYAEAQYSLGLCCAKGEGVAKDYNQAVLWFRKAAEQGHAEAQYDLGLSYHLGEGVLKEYGQAVLWFRKAAEQGYAEAQQNLGNYYSIGEGVLKDEIEAYAYWSLAGITLEDARKNLAVLEKKMSPDARSRGQQRSKELKKEIEAKQAGLLALSPAHAVMRPEVVKAFEDHKARALQGNPDAQCNVGYCYEIGQGVAKDLVQAAIWYRKAAEQGHAISQCNLGHLYCKGEGVKNDYEEALFWYRKAAEQGNAEAQSNLGGLYILGKGVTESGERAIYWWRKAADQGLAVAQYNLGVSTKKPATMFFFYPDKKSERAISWWRKAADQGHAQAQFELANCYAIGDDVAKDEIEAYAYYNLAGTTYDEAVKRLTVLEKKLSRDEVAAGQKRSKELQKEIEMKIESKKASK